jgi:transposase-like protein
LGKRISPHIRNVTKFVSWKDRKPLCADLRPIYTAPTIEAAELALDRFEQLWGARYPISATAWRNHWNVYSGRSNGRSDWSQIDNLDDVHSNESATPEPVRVKREHSDSIPSCHG